MDAAEARKLARACFPDYRGRRICVERQRYPLDPSSYWSEGRRSYFVAVDLKTGRKLEIPENGSPFTRVAASRDGIVIPPGFAVVEHLYFGTYQAVTIHLHGMPQVDAPASPLALAGS